MVTIGANVNIMTQTRFQSLIEAAINTLIGFAINFCANLLIFPFFGLSIGLSANLLMGAIYTLISIIRGYIIRRYFNERLAIAASMASKIKYS